MCAEEIKTSDCLCAEEIKTSDLSQGVALPQ